MKLAYCPECAAPLTQQNKTDYTCKNGHPYWNNPRVTATVLIKKGNMILASTRAEEPHKGKYDTLGGFAEYGEDPEAAAKREALEESGLIVDDLELVGGYSHEYGENENVSTCDFVFLAHTWHGDMKPSDDVASLVWKPLAIIDSPDFAWSYPGLTAKLKDKP